MSKVDAQRAMKAARHALTPAPATPAPARPAPARPAPAHPVAPTDAATAVTPDGTTTTPGSGVGPAAAEEPCGHRNMAGRECRRPAGHAEKSHRYS